MPGLHCLFAQHGKWVADMEEGWPFGVHAIPAWLTRLPLLDRCSIPESSGNTWGSIYPRDDLASVALDVCDEIAGLKVGGLDPCHLPCNSLPPVLGLHHFLKSCCDACADIARPAAPFKTAKNSS